MANGTSFNAAKASYPSYLFAKGGDTITVNGKEVTLKSGNTAVKASYTISGSLPIISETNIVDEVLKVIDEKTVEYANSMLQNIDKKVKMAESGNTLLKEGTTVEDA